MSNSEFGSQLQKMGIKDRFNRFLATPQYIMLIMLLAAVCNLFSMELAVYGVFTALVVYTCLFGEDLLAVLPIIACGYVTPSACNNPGKETASVFSMDGGGKVILLYGALIVAALLYSVIRHRKQFFSRKYKCLSGMLILIAGYLLCGIGSDAYPASLWPNLRYSLLQAGVLLLPYLIIAGGVNWEKTRKDYFAWTGFSMGGLLLLEIFWIYASGTILEDGIIIRTNIYTGWGMHNNIGGMLAMMIPFAFYLASKYRKGWIGTVAGSAFLAGVLLTCSRGSILVGSVIYLICVLLMLFYSQNRKTNFIALGCVAGVVAVLLICFHKHVIHLFSDILERGTDLTGRDIIYAEGIKLFRENPILGSSFFSPGYSPWEWSTNEGFTGLIPSRWHNTVVQLLASCGVVGLFAYGFHRIQTLRMFLKKRTKEGIFIGCSLLVLVLSSLVDCHFFNLGPVLFYSLGLAFAEKCE